MFQSRQRDTAESDTDGVQYGSEREGEFQFLKRDVA